MTGASDVLPDMNPKGFSHAGKCPGRKWVTGGGGIFEMFGFFLEIVFCNFRAFFGLPQGRGEAMT